MPLAWPARHVRVSTSTPRCSTVPGHLVPAVPDLGHDIAAVRSRRIHGSNYQAGRFAGSRCGGGRVIVFHQWGQPGGDALQSACQKRRSTHARLDVAEGERSTSL